MSSAPETPSGAPSGAPAGGLDRRRLVALGTGSAAIAALIAAAFVGLSDAPPRAGSEAVAAGETPSEHRSRPGDVLAEVERLPADALAFLKAKDPGGKTARHVREVRETGVFVRVYTDLKDYDANSAAAIKICEWTVEFLEDELDDPSPRVFVHGTSKGNGSVVLANRQGDEDDCKVGKTI